MRLLKILIDQTVFLLEKQKEANADCISIFGDLLVVVKDKLGQKKNSPEEIAGLEQIKSLVSEQSEKIKEEALVDINFLTEQLEALRKVEVVHAKDPVKGKELFDMLVDKDDEIKDTEVFKKEVIKESALSKESLVTMVNDIKEAVVDGNAQEVAVYLKSILESDDSDDDGDDLEDDGDGEFDDAEIESEGGGCGGCKGCSGGGCGSGCGKGSTDVFADLERFEKTLHKDSADSSKKNKH